MGSNWRRPRARRLTALSLAVAVGFCALSGAVIADMRRDAWTRASEAANNLNRAVGQDLRRSFEAVGLSLQAVVNNLHQPGVADLEPGLRNLLLFDNAATAPHIGSLLVLDAAGEVVIDAASVEPRRANFADRDFFQVHRDRPDVGLYVSRPFQGPLVNQRLVGLSRRLSNPDGSFAGVVLGTLKLDYLRDLFSGLALGPNGRITLLRSDGIALMRAPYQPELIGRDFSEGTAFHAIPEAADGHYESVSRRDGIRRVYTFSRIDGLPLIINVGVAAKDVEAGWLARAAVIGGTTLVLVGALLAATLLLRRELARRRAAEVAARESEAGFRLLAENTSDMVSRIGPDGILRYVSPAARRILGRAPEELVGQAVQAEAHPEDQQAMANAMAVLRSGQADEATVTYRAQRADGVQIWLESTLRTVIAPANGMPDGAVAVSRDVTERKAFEAELARLASLDGLTGVANRRAFDEALGREWQRCARAAVPISLLLVDVDRFKAFNDHYGHQHGDECLRVVAATVGAIIRHASDLVARYGGEEFAVLLPDTDAMAAEAVAERLRAEVEALGLAHDGCGLSHAVVTVSVGGATLQPDTRCAAHGPGQLIEAADRALYQAKRSGRNRVVSWECVQDPILRSAPWTRGHGMVP